MATTPDVMLHSLDSQNTCITTIDEFDDSFSDCLPKNSHSSLSKTDSATSRQEEKSLGYAMFAANNNSRKSSGVTKEDIEMTEVAKKDSRLGLMELGSSVRVCFETRDGTAREGTAYTRTEGDLVSCS